MVFSYLKNLITSFFYPNEGEDDEELNENENEEELLRKISEIDDETVPVSNEPLQDGTSEEQVEDKQPAEVYKTYAKTGKVTFINQEYGLIDHDLYFEHHQVHVGLNLKINDVVSYLATKAAENQSEKVMNVRALVNPDAPWDDKNEQNDAAETEEATNVQAIKRIINGQVTERKERLLKIEPSGTWCNLDNIEFLTSFVPVEGDWVSLGAIVTVDEEVTDLTGDIIEIKTIKPLRHLTEFGRITFLMKKGGDGVIENKVYFTQEVCETGYIPHLGDEVIYEKIESEQDKYTWRAISVHAIDIPKKEDETANDAEKQQLLRDKNGIGVVGVTDFGEVRMNEVKELILEVKNFGKSTQTLFCSRFHTSKNSSQIRLKSPNLNDRFDLKPGGYVKYVFECKGRFIGYSEELFVFNFKNFKIGRNLEMSILPDKEMHKLMPTDSVTHIKRSFHARAQNALRNSREENHSRTYGAKPKSAPKFIKGERPGLYKIPEKLWKMILGESGFPKPQERVMKDIENFYTFLKGDQKFPNYGDWFHLLLYLEEAAVRLALRRFEMEGVIMRRMGEFLVLEVPGLQEQRPSLIIGDRVIVSQPWLDKDTQDEHVGYIHEIRAKDVFIKFHASFQDKYDESDCKVYFESNMSNLQRAHDAIHRALRHGSLGGKWLFPSAVQEKPEQIIFESIENFRSQKQKESSETTDSVSAFFKKLKSEGEENLDRALHEKHVEVEYDVDKDGFLIPRNLEKSKTNQPVAEPKKSETREEKIMELKKKKLRWFNKKLNYQQKASVVNVLKGQGRPLPYIIFGPPGTGKTITLVETILQIYTLLPESRILVGTPSNSSADLLCERIIDSGVLLPGELVRIIAYHRACEGNIPEKLLPYCTTTDLRDDKGSADMYPQPENQLKQSSLTQLLGRHRITVGTCSALGSMHYMGFPNGHFTHILVDEAGQALEPEILVPITFLDPQKGQVILAGDPEQLGPICISKIAEEYLLGISLLQRFVKRFPYTRDHVSFPDTNGYDPRFITRLCVNYRSIPEILDLPSKLFYNSELVPTVSATDSTEFEICKKFNEANKNLREPAPSIIFHGIQGHNHQEGDCPSWYNPAEVLQCVAYLKKCYSIGLTEDQCGIVTPYKKQVKKIRDLLTELEAPVPKIGTVEDFQGQERFVIILSPVRSSLSHVGTDIKHSLGFVASPRRLNVALTRARALLIIVGNPLLLSTDPYWRSVLVYCVQRDSYLGCSLNKLPGNINSGLNGNQEDEKTEGEDFKNGIEVVSEIVDDIIADAMQGDVNGN